MKVRTNISTEEFNVLEEDLNEPKSTQRIDKRAVRILYANYEQADLKQIAEVEGLNVEEKKLLYELLLRHETLFDGTLGDFKTKPASIEVKPSETPAYSITFPVCVSRREAFKK